MSKRKQHHLEFRAKVALEALKGEETLSQSASRFGGQPIMLYQWKRAMLEGGSGLFERGILIGSNLTRSLYRLDSRLVGSWP